MVKKITAFFICIITVMALTTTALTASAYSYINGTTQCFGVATGTANYTCLFVGVPKTTTKFKITASLQQLKNGSWVNLASKTQTYDNYYGTLSGSKAITKGYKYRIKAVYVAYAGSKSETFTTYSVTLSY